MTPSPASDLPSQASAHEVSSHIERALQRAVGRLAHPSCPPVLAAACRYAVFPGGARLRPHLCVVAALSSGVADLTLAAGVASALELIHCASLVHDDLPCFDDADLRRGRPSVHRTFGEPIAVLVGDALIVAGFEALAIEAPTSAVREMVALLARAAGAPRGIVAGQAWESEPSVLLDEYHRAKTAALFEAAAALGALSGGADPAPWARLGETVGRAYQAIDDVEDALGSPGETGKPCGRDEALGRPSLARAAGITGARRRVHELLEHAASQIPPCSDPSSVRGWLEALAEKASYSTQESGRRLASTSRTLRAGG